MRKFDVDAIDSGLTQYWSSLSSTTNTISPQVSGTGVSGIVFEYGLTYNEGFEQLDNWNIMSASRFELDTTVFNTGGSSLKILPAASGGSGLSLRFMNVEPGQTYKFTYDLRRDAAFNGTDGNSKIRIAKSSDSSLLTAFGFGVPGFSQIDTWITRSSNFTIPAGITQMDIQISNDNTAGNVWMDNLRVQRIDSLTSIAPVSGNRNIAKGAPASIGIGTNPGVVTSTNPIKDFIISFLVQPNTSDLWLLKMADVGVKVKSDTSIQLSWPVTTSSVDDDGNLTSATSIQTQSLVYSEDTSFVSLSRTGNTVTMSVNGKTVSIEGDDISFTTFQFGGGTGTALIDKIAYSTTGIQIRLGTYVNLFKSQRLDTVPRPEGNTGFSYLLDSSAPDVSVYDRSDFEQLDDYQYVNYYNPFETGVIRIDKRASFLIEYTVDQGLNWLPVPTKLKLSDYYSNVIFRHQDMSDEAFYIQVVSTSTVYIPMAFHDALVTGDVYLPSEVGFGYYDADPGDFYDATVRLTSNEGASIRSLEMLAIINSTTGVLNTDTGVPAGTWYVNGVPRALSTVKPDQLYHLVFVSDVNMPWVEVTQGHQVEIAGIGASDIAYAQSDAYYIFNTFAGNPLITALEDVDVLVDGVSDSGDAASLLDLQWNK